MVSSTTSVVTDFPNLAYDGRGQKFASIAVTAGATGAIVAAVTNARIRVLGLYLNQVGSSTATVQFKSASTAISGVITVKATDMHMVLSFNPAGWMETESGEALNLTTVNTAVAGFLVYEEVTVA